MYYELMHRMVFYQDDENKCPLLLLLEDEKWKGCHLLPGMMKICNAHVCFKVERWIRFINVYMCVQEDETFCCCDL